MDWRLFQWVNTVQRGTTWAHGPLRLYARVGVVVFPLAIVVAWWAARRERDPRRVAAAAWAALAALEAFVVNQLVGHLVLRSRPYVAHSGVHLLVGRTGDFSFPSDHLAVGAAVAAALFLVDRRLGLVAAILACFMALARVYVGAHYPGDVAGGIVVGVLVALAGWPLAVRGLEPLAARLTRWPLRPLVAARDTE